MSGASSTAAEDEEEGSAGVGKCTMASAGFSVGTRVAVPALGDGLFFWLWLLSIKRLAFQSSKERKRSSSTGSKGVRDLRQQMGSSDGLGARAATAWNGSYGVVGGGEWPDST